MAKAKAPSLKAILTTYLDPATPEDAGIGVYSEKTLTVKEAKDIGKVLAALDFPTLAAATDPMELAGKLHTLTNFFQQVENAKVGWAMLENVLPYLMRIYDQWLPLPSLNDFTAMFMVKVFAMTRTEAGTERVAAAAARFPDNYLWTIVFPTYADGHDYLPSLISKLTNPLPRGLCAVAFLDLCNTLCGVEEPPPHPFDTPQGHARLAEWLRITDPDELSYANSAARALAYLDSEGRDALFALGMNHPDIYIRLQTARSAGFVGNDSGVRFLLRQCMDVNYTLPAQHYLGELGLEHRIPDEVQSGDFLATAHMSDWLQSPDLFNAVPDRLDMIDKRVMYWPPTRDTRTFWLFAYTYGKGRQRKKGVGLVGSLTTSLIDETNPTMDPEDIYALHCCYELQQNEDKRAPKKRTIAAGRKLLGLGRKRS